MLLEVTCNVCRSREETPATALSALVRGPSGGYFHARCLRVLLELPTPGIPEKCRHCDALVGVNIGINAIEVNPCGNCGSPEPVESVACEWCQAPIYPWQTGIGALHSQCRLMKGKNSSSAISIVALFTCFILLVGFFVGLDKQPRMSIFDAFAIACTPALICALLVWATLTMLCPAD